MDPSVYYFYVSCTRDDGWPLITRFHADLEYRLRVHEGLGVSGTLSALVDPAAVREGAVNTSRVMIALYSPEYFRSSWCGLEWDVFRRRMSRYDDAYGPGESTPSLILLSWKPVPEADLPADLPAPEPGPEMPDGSRWTQGILELGKADSPEKVDAYFSLVDDLAQRIVRVQRTKAPALDPLDQEELSQVEPAFGRIDVDAPVPVHAVPRPAERALQLLAAGEAPSSRPANSSALRISISYVGADQAWADWMYAVLAEAGHTVRQERWRAGREQLSVAVDRSREGADRVVVVFSRNYFNAAKTEPTEWETTFADLGEDPAWFVPVQVDAAPLPVLVRRVELLRLQGSEEDQARSLREEVTAAYGPTYGRPPKGQR